MTERNLSLGATLRARRQALRLTLDEVAASAGVSRPTVSNLERNQGQRSSLDRVAGVLGLRLVGDDLAAARRRRGWSALVAGERSGLSAPTVRAAEAGRGRLESLVALAAAVRVRLTLAGASGRYFGPGGVAHSSESVEWYTPAPVVTGILAATGLMRFDLDPASPASGAELTHVPAVKRLTVADDGLSADWHGDVWLNPPYGRVETPRWVAKCAAEAARGVRIVALLPASTDTDWWHDHVVGSMATAVPVRGRIAFWGPGATGQPAPFRSAVVLWGWSPEVARRVAALPRGWTRQTVPLDWFERARLAA